MHGSTIHSAGAIRSCRSPLVSARLMDGATACATHIGTTRRGVTTMVAQVATLGAIPAVVAGRETAVAQEVAGGRPGGGLGGGGGVAHPSPPGSPNPAGAPPRRPPPP